MENNKFLKLLKVLSFFKSRVVDLRNRNILPLITNHCRSCLTYLIISFVVLCIRDETSQITDPVFNLELSCKEGVHVFCESQQEIRLYLNNLQYSFL